jgi:O-antigen ligase
LVGFALSPNILGPALAAVCLLWAACRWPYIFVVLTMWTAVVPTIYAFQVGPFGFAPYVLFEAFAMVGLAFQLATGRVSIAAPPGFKWFIVHVLLTSASALLAADPVAAASMLVRLWLNWLMVFLVLAVTPDRRRLMNFVAALFLQAFVVVGISVSSSLSNLDLPSFPSLLFLHFQKNDYATYLSFAVALAVMAIAAKPSHIGGRIAGVALLMLVGVSWPLTYSRSGLLSLLGMLLTLVLLYRTRRLLAVLAVVVVVAGAAWMVLPPEVKAISVRAVQSVISPDKERDSFDETYEDRVMLNWAAVESIARRPLLGVGLGEWVSESPLQIAIWDVKKQGVVNVGANIHNRYLLIAAESGIAALAGYLGLLGVLLKSAMRLRRHADAWMRLLLSSLIACTAGFLVSNLFIPGTLWEWNLLAVLATAVHIAMRENVNAPSVRLWRPRLVNGRG